MKNYIQKGDVITLAAPYDVLSGAGALAGTVFGVATVSALSGADCEFQLVGVVDLPKVSAQAWTQGAAIYWDNTAKLVTTVSSANTKIGTAVLAAANPSDTGRVRLNGSF